MPNPAVPSSDAKLFVTVGNWIIAAQMSTPHHVAESAGEMVVLKMFSTALGLPIGYDPDDPSKSRRTYLIWPSEINNWCALCSSPDMPPSKPGEVSEPWRFLVHYLREELVKTVHSGVLGGGLTLRSPKAIVYCSMSDALRSTACRDIDDLIARVGELDRFCDQTRYGTSPGDKRDLAGRVNYLAGLARQSVSVTDPTRPPTVKEFLQRLAALDAEPGGEQHVRSVLSQTSTLETVEHEAEQARHLTQPDEDPDWAEPDHAGSTGGNDGAERR